MLDDTTGEGLRQRLRNIIPLNASGLALFVVSVSLLCWTYTSSSDHVLRVFALVGGCLPVVSIVLVWTGAIIVGRRLHRMPASAVPIFYCGSHPPTNEVPTSLPFLEVTVKWLEPPTNESGLFDRRGLYDGIKRRFTISDPLHLASISLTREQISQIEVRPAQTQPLEQWVPPVAVSAGEEWAAKGKAEGDMMEIGTYQQGDPLKYRLWKVEARRGGKMKYVRRPETVGDNRIAYYFMAGRGDDVTAELADYLLREGQIHSSDIFSCSTDDEGGSSGSSEDARRRLALSGNLTMLTDQFDRFQQEAARQRAAACVVFLPERGSEDLRRQLASTRCAATYFVTGIRDGRTATSRNTSNEGSDIQIVNMTEPSA